MKKGLSNFIPPRSPNSNKEQKKDDHFSYFQNLEQKLLHESDKLTNLIGVKSLSSSDSRSVKDLAISKVRNVDSLPRQSCLSANMFEEEPEKDTRASVLVQNYIQNKRKMLLSSKSQELHTGKDKESQLQRKLTYNMIMPKTSQQTLIPRQISPTKSENKQILKTTTSTSSSAVLMRTIDKIKRMSSKPNLQIKNSDSIKPLTIQDFQILKYMEEGQFGTVYLSRHKATNFICALKKIPKKIFEGQYKFIHQLVRQIKIQSYLDHPNIVQLYSFFSDEQNLYLILQLCCGGNVYNNLRSEGRFQQQKVKSIIKQVSHAIQFMHDSDIIHRDIKPENILFHQNVIKVCDFGWSIHSPLLRDTRCGTPLYSSPQVVQKQQYDNKIDVWNIGILTYELIFGRVPFEIRTQDDLVKVVDEEIYFSKGILITNEAKDFILSCLHKNPKQRLPMSKLVDHPFIQRSRNS